MFKNNHENEIVIDDDGKTFTRRQVTASLRKENDKLRGTYGKRYRIIFQWSPYWKRGMFYIQRRRFMFFWMAVRDGEHNPSTEKPKSLTTAFNPQWFDRYIIPILERSRKQSWMLIR